VSVGDEMTLDHASLIDDAADWIAGEPARLAAAREEAVAACAVEFERALAEGESFTLPGLATPLADEITALREAYAKREAALLAERDALRAAVATADEAVRYWTEQAQHGAKP
jgi:hypothetical protein